MDKPLSPSNTRQPRAASTYLNNGAASPDASYLPSVAADKRGATDDKKVAPSPYSANGSPQSIHPRAPSHLLPSALERVVLASRESASPGRSSLGASPVGSPTAASERRLLPRPAKDVTGSDVHESVSPQRAAAFEHNHLAPWDKPSTWRALRSDQVDVLERVAGTGTLPSPARRPATREASEVAQRAERTAHASVPGAFFTRMILRAAPSTRTDHTGTHLQVISRRRGRRAFAGQWRFS